MKRRVYGFLYDMDYRIHPHWPEVFVHGWTEGNNMVFTSQKQGSLHSLAKEVIKSRLRERGKAK